MRAYPSIFSDGKEPGRDRGRTLPQGEGTTNGLRTSRILQGSETEKLLTLGGILLTSRTCRSVSNAKIFTKNDMIVFRL